MGNVSAAPENQLGARGQRGEARSGRNRMQRMRGFPEGGRILTPQPHVPTNPVLQPSAPGNIFPEMFHEGRQDDGSIIKPQPLVPASIKNPVTPSVPSGPAKVASASVSAGLKPGLASAVRKVSSSVPIAPASPATALPSVSTPSLGTAIKGMGDARKPLNLGANAMRGYR